MKISILLLLHHSLYFGDVIFYLLQKLKYSVQNSEKFAKKLLNEFLSLQQIIANVNLIQITTSLLVNR